MDPERTHLVIERLPEKIQAAPGFHMSSRGSKGGRGSQSVMSSPRRTSVSIRSNSDHQLSRFRKTRKTPEDVEGLMRAMTIFRPFI